MKQYEVAVIVDENGEVIGALKCKMVDENEFKQLLIKAKDSLAKNRLEKVRTKEKIDDLYKKVEKLGKEIKLLKGEE